MDCNICQKGKILTDLLVIYAFVIIFAILVIICGVAVIKIINNYYIKAVAIYSNIKPCFDYIIGVHHE